MDVLAQYMKITGVQPVKGQDREYHIGLVLDALGDERTWVDEDLLHNYEQVGDDTLIAQWLLNGRNPVRVDLETVIHFSQETFYLGNLTRDKGDAVEQAKHLLTEGILGSEIAQQLLQDGYSYNEVADALRRLRYVWRGDILGDLSEPNQAVPAMWVSNQPRTKRWWQFWIKETADLTCYRAIWSLPVELIQKFGLPIMPVQLVRVDVS